MSEKKFHPEDEVNLTGVRAALIDLLRIFFELLAFLGFSIRKHKYFIIISIAIGISVGYGYRASKSSQYKATMIVQFNKLTVRTYSEMVDQLNHLVSFGNRGVLARQLNIADTMAQKMLNVEALDMEDRDLSADTSTKVDQPFKIVATVSDPDAVVLDTLQAGILHYLNYSPMLARASMEADKYNRYKLQVLDSDLVNLDTLKREYNHFLSSTKVSATYYNNAVNPAEFYAQTVNLLFQREMTLRDLNVNQFPLAVVDGLKVSVASRWSKLPKAVILLAGVAALLSILIAFLVETKKRIMRPYPAAPGPNVNVNPGK